jgi:hypothetical protein
VSKKCFENLRITVNMIGYTLKSECFETCIGTFFSWLIDNSHHSAAEHRASTRLIPSHCILGIGFDLHPGLSGLYEHCSSPGIPQSPPALFTLGIPL